MESSIQFDTLLGYLQSVIATLPDVRRPSPNQRYLIRDAVLSAFGIFFMQCPSFLEYQRQLHSRQGRDNAETLFGVAKIPSDNQIRNLLDPIAATHLYPVFERIYRTLQKQGVLRPFQVLDKHLLIALDSTEYFSSKTIHCQQCSHCQHRNGSVTYFHRAILPVIVSPHQSAVISLAPEFIAPQDGHNKQDCESVAAKRWMAAHQSLLIGQKVILLGDDLYSRQPMCEFAIQHGYHYLFSCLPESHPTLYQVVAEREAQGTVESMMRQHRDRKTEYRSEYRWVNAVPLRETEPVLEVNWLEVTVVRVSDETVVYRNQWITDHPVTDSTVEELVKSGRSRWHTENQNHNVLKTKGYHLEHNFGHGQQHLAAFLLTLNLLAFLFHTVLDLRDKSYQQIRQRLGTRQRFFNDLRALTTYLVFESWSDLIAFMWRESAPRAPSSRRR